MIAAPEQAAHAFALVKTDHRADPGSHKFLQRDQATGTGPDDNSLEVFLLHGVTVISCQRIASAEPPTRE